MSSYYKVVKQNANGDYCSAILSGPLSIQCGITIKYMLNEWVKPNIPRSQILVFSNKVDAETFALLQFKYSSQKMLVFECEVKNPSTSGMFAVASPRYVAKMWHAYNNQQSGITYTQYLSEEIPKGTIWADEIKLIREVCPD